MERLALIYDELAKGRIEERQIIEHGRRPRPIAGFCTDNGVVIVNPMPDVLDTLIHELFHRRYPLWSERTVRRETTKTLNSLTVEQQRALYFTYNKCKRPLRRRKAVK